MRLHPLSVLRRANLVVALSIMALSFSAVHARSSPARYFKIPPPVTIRWPAQAWEGDQQPHTLSVVEINQHGFKYWGWYGLNHGRGMGLARSNDLIHWTKFEGNPLRTNARWPSVVKSADFARSNTLYFAITRDYDTPSSRIVLATSQDGQHLTEIKDLVPPVPNQRNQNPNLFWDPPTQRFILTFYRGNDQDFFDIVSKSASTVQEIDQAPETILIHSNETVAAPTLLYLPNAGPTREPLYDLATEIYPNRYGKSNEGEWQVRVYSASRAGGPFAPVAGNPVQKGGRACLFQHEFHGKFYGYQSHLDRARDQWTMEVLVAAILK